MRIVAELDHKIRREIRDTRAKCRCAARPARKAIQPHLLPQVHRQARVQSRTPGIAGSRPHQDRGSHQLHPRKLPPHARTSHADRLVEGRIRRRATPQPRRERSCQERRHDGLGDPTGRNLSRHVQEADRGSGEGSPLRAVATRS
jgi:hypothetical protein